MRVRSYVQTTPLVRSQLQELIRHRRIEERVAEARRKAERAEERLAMAEYLKRKRRERRVREAEDYADRVRARRVMRGLLESQDRGLAGSYVR